MKLYETVISQLAGPRPGRIELRGNKIIGAIQLDRGVLEFDDREDLLSLIISGRKVLEQMDEALRRRAVNERPLPAQGQPARPYTAAGGDTATAVMAPPAAPAPAAPAGPRHAAATPPGVQPLREGQVVPDPPAAAAP
ncbi:hypothetical protein AB0J35_57955 [Nonomuraea angiospora]|uniref:hypothetical protein n=1 Tax=Nonomuraea angiospora TaxID=46172 RepID=UPI00342729F7